ncbi:MAG: Holliday junction DNA helicase RuvA [Candidatus Andersenbacteria bacterium RIFCSPHIGHO2_12_FULL_45_11b]|uniref:Holliday junction branch migration complex subunit RuvA n=1 Tax=Candidatus Andersenbacteria bacterium RIFCSPHIGHO2_12_FULL_45_11b TaxID=1797282 RepID=A0A1G1XBB2_9BACT|nr:MAG: Holliday junction DNA helicase RuvA [Candidatus Andersenbacteria bacterium RIFCSPHIGHO2_12_FULL_45_11b]
MIARLTGRVLEREEKAVILDVHGVGYRVFVVSVLREKLAVGQDTSFVIYDHKTESDEILFGFEQVRDREYFELLLRVPSIGPKTAMGILDVVSPHMLSQAVATGDVALLTSMPGVGKKTAERIIIELKGKLDALPSGSVFALHRPVHQETVDALIAIGYTQVQARQVVEKLPKDIATVEEAVKAALKYPASS